MGILLKFYRPAWPYAAIDDAGMARAAFDGLAAGDRRWVIVDYRLPGGDAVAADPRLERVAVPDARDDVKMRLFRTR